MAKKEKDTDREVEQNGPGMPEPKKDIRRMKSIPEDRYNALMDYLSTKPYREVAPHIATLGRALDTNVEVVPD